MARKSSKSEVKLNYSAEIKKLREEGPKNLYILCGQEDYLREQFLAALKEECIPEGEDSFSYKRINGPALDLSDFEESLNSIPFMTERSFIELRDIDINKLKNPDSYVNLISDIPDYCTVAFVLGSDYEMDRRLKFVKALRSKGYEMKFTQQSQNLLFSWISRRFAAAGKSIGRDAIQRLVFISGDLMNMLIPEIEKVAAYAKGDSVTTEDVEAVAHHIPEADIFSMTDYISRGQYDSAAGILAELLADKSDKNSEPIYILAVLGAQMRKLYAARLALDEGLGIKYIMDCCSVKYEFIAKNLIQCARGYSLERLKRALELCCEADYKMKSSSQDDDELLKELVMRIAAGDE
ncbi:MAG: DNA polymerase III subunit delta [Candidatus Limivicinus sp.]|jgi:DNA polymerase-3 subunit delta